MFFLDDKEIRAYEIIHLIGNEKKNWSVSEISSMLNYGIDAVYKALDDIQFYLAENAPQTQLIIKKGIGIYLEKPDDVALDSILEKFVTSSMTYTLMDSAFNYPHLRARQFYEQHFITKSTFYFKVKRLQNNLHTRHLGLQTNPLRITGSEIWVRECYYNLYWLTYKGRMWPFRSISREVLVYQLDEFLRKVHAYVNTIEKEQLLYRLAVRYMRHAQKCYVREMPLQNCVPPQVVQFIKDHGKSLLNEVPQPYKELEEKYLTIAISNLMYPKTHDPITASLIAWNRREQTLPFKIAENFLNEFTKYYPDITIEDNDRIWLNLINANFYGLSLPYLYVYNRIRKQADYFRSEHPALWKNLDKITTQLFQLDGMKQAAAPSIYFCYKYMILIIERFSMKKYEPKLEVALLTNQDSAVLNKLKSQILRKLDLNIELFTHAIPKTVDLTITETKILSDNPESIFIWNFPPTQSDWACLEDTLREIRDKKLAEAMD
ncbi:helix-turn-helix domain-containing protein [Listeria rocourtiae]|uniref:helix-turn-helix domain-containing protein n=1 Tax=Listeria rocourtiae TaxID=647910 RepID=UPI003D2F6AFE